MTYLEQLLVPVIPLVLNNDSPFLLNSSYVLRQQKCPFQEPKAWVCNCVFPFHLDSPSSDCYVLTSFPFHNTKPQPYNRCGRRCRRFSTGVDIRLAKKYMKTPAHNFKSERIRRRTIQVFPPTYWPKSSLRTIDTFWLILRSQHAVVAWHEREKTTAGKSIGHQFRPGVHDGKH